ncbi:MAG: hypothetical protein VXV97_01420 [Pseudomonadota bacterium]|nr:hypothetical protein [Pseudomonadota bacterium]
MRSFWRGESDETGLLSHSASGSLFDYDRDTEDDDEPLFRFDDHVFKDGEYVSVIEQDGRQRTFQVVSVD